MVALPIRRACWKWPDTEASAGATTDAVEELTIDPKHGMERKKVYIYIYGSVDPDLYLMNSICGKKNIDVFMQLFGMFIM